MYFRIAFTTILLVVLIFVVSHAINIKNLPEIIFSYPKDQLLVLVGIALSISVLKAWRFLIILRNSDIKVTFLQNLKAFMASQAISPLPGGESMRGVLIHKETGTNLSHTTGPVITQAYLELLSGAIFALIGSLAFDILRVPILLFLLFLIALAFCLSSKKILIIVRNKVDSVKLLNPVLDRFIRTQRNIKSHFYDEKTHLPDKVLIWALSLSLISNLLGGVLLLIIAKNYGTNVNLFQTTFTNSAGIIIQGLSVFSPGGIGFTEGGMTGILLGFHITTGTAIAIVLLFRVLTLFLNVILGLILIAIFYSKALILKK